VRSSLSSALSLILKVSVIIVAIGVVRERVLRRNEERVGNANTPYGPATRRTFPDA
jgi:hypothetical protein